MMKKLLQMIFLDGDTRRKVQNLERQRTSKAAQSHSVLPKAYSPGKKFAGAVREAEELRVGGTEDEQETIRHALDEVHREIMTKGTADDRISPDKKDLIKAAMAVYRAKKGIIEDLDPESRARLKSMAETVFAGTLKKK